MQDTSARAAGRPSVARDDRVSCIQPFWKTKSSFILELPTRVMIIFIFMIFIDVHIDII